MSGPDSAVSDLLRPVNRHLLVAMVGTDHHPFDRLVDWMDDLALRLEPDVHVVVQHGASRAPLVAEGRPFLSHRELAALLARADAVVCHGGPGTVMDARDAGHVPVCVARDPGRGEHIDGHQQRFVAMAARTGLVTAAASRPELTRVVTWALDGGRPERPAADAARAEAAEWSCRLLARELDPLCGLRPTRRSSIARVLRSKVLR